MKNNPDLISVVIPMFNNRCTLDTTLRSVMGQTFKNFEVLLVDDGSSDSYCDILRPFENDERVRYLRLPHNGANTARNYGILNSRGAYIAMLDADDSWFPSHLEECLQTLRETGGDGVYGSVIIHDVSSGSESSFYVYECSRETSMINYLLATGFGAQTSTLFMTASSGKGILWDESLYRHQDYDFVVRYAQRYTWKPKVNPTTVYRAHPSDGKMDFLSCIRFIEQHKSEIVPELYERYTRQMLDCARQSKASEEIIRYYQRALEPESLQACKGILERPTDMDCLQVPVTGNCLTLIIPFLNEREEVRNTVASARSFVGEEVDILVINDHSADCYDYRAYLQGLNVTYVYNRERLGVAASRNLGVRLCTTPYFLLLDAHMRFYDNRWADAIVRLLEKDDRCVLCAQTKVLHKENGTVYEDTEAQPMYGAYLPFVKENFIPDINWNICDFFPEDRTAPIASVLGAGYAASVRYWKYLRGLEGLLHYGSDEAYLSLKVWLEGGRCYLLKDIVIGHIYREVSPYVNMNEKLLYNHLLISYLLFPPSLCGMSFAIAQKKNPADFQKAKRCLFERKAEINILKSYYRQIFTVPFEKVLMWNQIVSKEEKEKIEQESECLPLIAEWISGHIPSEGCGLVSGKMACVVWLLGYVQFSKESKWCKLAQEQWAAVSDAVKKGKRLSLTFRDGLSGIGWGMIYLSWNGLWTERISDLLEVIDTEIERRDFHSCQDSGFETGPVGVLCYVVTRIRYAAHKGEVFSYSATTVNSLKQAARQIQMSDQSDVYELNFANQYLRLMEEGVDVNDMPPSFYSWMSYPPYLTRDSRFWEIELPYGVLGRGLFIMSILSNLKKSPYYES